jgi:hypothetical protein
MRVGIRTVIVTYALALAVLVIALGPARFAYVAAFAGMAVMAGVMAHSTFVALRNWQLDKLPGLHLPRWWDGRRV